MFFSKLHIIRCQSSSVDCAKLVFHKKCNHSENYEFPKNDSAHDSDDEFDKDTLLRRKRSNLPPQARPQIVKHQMSLINYSYLTEELLLLALCDKKVTEERKNITAPILHSCHPIEYNKVRSNTPLKFTAKNTASCYYHKWFCWLQLP